MRVYKHYRPSLVIFPLIAFCGLFGAAGLIGFVWTLSRGWDSEPPPFVFLFLMAFAVYMTWLLGWFAVEVHLSEDGNIEFIGPLRRMKLAVSDIVSITPWSSQMYLYVVRHRNGRLRVDGRLDGMHELVGELKRLNPTIRLRGI